MVARLGRWSTLVSCVSSERHPMWSFVSIVLPFPPTSSHWLLCAYRLSAQVASMAIGRCVPRRIYHFDGQGDAERPWLPCQEFCWGKPCWCASIRDRLSASMINAKLPRVNGKMPLYTDNNGNAAAGFVLNPSFNRVLCAYPAE